MRINFGSVALTAALAEIAASEDVLQPLLLSFESKNARLVAISLNCLQKMILAKAVADASLPLVVKVLRDASDGDAGQDIHLKVLQTLQPLLSNYPSITDALLAEVLLLCFRLYTAKLPVVSNTAAATVEQLVIHCFDKVAGELERGDAPSAAEPFSNVAAALASLEPFAKDAFLLFQDICLLTNGDPAEWLKVGSIPRSFGLELVGAVLTNHHKTFVAVRCVPPHPCNCMLTRPTVPSLPPLA